MTDLANVRIGATVAVIDPHSGREIYGNVTGISASGDIRYAHVKGFKIPVGRREGGKYVLHESQVRSQIYTQPAPPEPTGTAVITRVTPPEPEVKTVAKQVPLGGAVPPYVAPPEPQLARVTSISTPTVTTTTIPPEPKPKPVTLTTEARKEVEEVFAPKFVSKEPEPIGLIPTGKVGEPQLTGVSPPSQKQIDKMLGTTGISKIVPTYEPAPKRTDLEKLLTPSGLTVAQLKEKKGIAPELIVDPLIGAVSFVAQDIPYMVTHPIETVKAIPKMPEAIIEMGKTPYGIGKLGAMIALPKVTGKITGKVVTRVRGKSSPLYEITEVPELRRLTVADFSYKYVPKVSAAKIVEPFKITEVSKRAMTGKEITGLIKKPHEIMREGIGFDLLGGTVTYKRVGETIVPYGIGRKIITPKKPKAPSIVDVEITKTITGKRVKGIGEPMKPVSMRELLVTKERIQFLKPPKVYKPKVGITSLPKGKRTPLIFEPVKKAPKRAPEYAKVPDLTGQILKTVKRQKKAYIPWKVRTITPKVAAPKIPSIISPILKPSKVGYPYKPRAEFPMPKTDIWGQISRKPKKIPKGLQISSDILMPKKAVRGTFLQLPKAKTKERLDLGLRPITKPRGITRDLIRPSLRPVLKPAVKPFQITTPRITPKQRQKVTPRLLITPSYDFGVRTTYPKPPTPRALTIPLLPFKIPTGKKRKRKEELFGLPKVTTKYKPSLIAVGLDIVGKKPKRLTGLEIRPMLKRSGRKRGRGFIF